MSRRDLVKMALAVRQLPAAADYRLRVLRRISRTVCAVPFLELIDSCLTFVSFAHEGETGILRYKITSVRPIPETQKDESAFQPR